jgi:hypothetical protein
VFLLLPNLAISLLENPFVLCNTMIHVNLHVSIFGFIDWIVKTPRWPLPYNLRVRPRGYVKMYWDMRLYPIQITFRPMLKINIETEAN